MGSKVHVVQSSNFPPLEPEPRCRCRINAPRHRQTRQGRQSLSSADAGLIGIVAAAFFALGLGDVPFVDEYAYITQSYQPDLLFAGQTNHPSWLEGLSYDLVPLPKYFINLAYRASSIPRPTRRDAIAWYQNTSYQWGGARELVIARLPSILLAAVGCIAIFAIGTMIKDQQTGAIAAFLLAVNPLYRLHAHRAMSEAPCEAILLVSLGLGLWAWKLILARGSLGSGTLAMIAAGLAAGLSILAKFNGLLALITLAAWTCLGLAIPGIAALRKLVLALAAALAALAAGLLFIGGNPFMTAHPTVGMPPELQATADLNVWQRFRLLVDHRVEVSRGQQSMFSHNAVHAMTDRLSVLIIQGFGRFGPFGPAKSDSLAQVRPRHRIGERIVWLPLVLAGFFNSIVWGRRQIRAGQMPTGWALALWASIATAVVAAYLPMAWDRYLLPIQAPCALLVAVILASTATTLRARLFAESSRP